MAIPDEESTLIYKNAKSGYSRGLADANRPDRPEKELDSDIAGLPFPGLFRWVVTTSERSRRPVSPVEPTVNNQGGSQ